MPGTPGKGGGLMFRATADGVVEEIKGRAKEAAGAIVDDERLEREGGAQQRKAAALRDEAEHEAGAAAARARARREEAEQRRHQSG